MGGERFFCAGDDWLQLSMEYNNKMIPAVGYGAKLCVVDPPVQENKPARTDENAEWISNIAKCTSNKKHYTRMEEDL